MKKKKIVLEFSLIAGVVLLAGCARSTTGAEIDRIMAEARKQAAMELARSRAAWGVNTAAADTAEGATLAASAP